jgi:hypothetical protein
MHFQLRTDNHIKNSEDLADRVRAAVEGSLTRHYAERVRRMEVYLQDVNGHKGGIDKRCAIEAHLAGHQPVAVSHQAASVDEAVGGAVDKLSSALEHTLGRLADREGHKPASGAPPT